MGWKGIVVGVLLGFAITHSFWGAVICAIIGYVLDQGAGLRSAASAQNVSVAQEFFRRTFELMGYVAKSDGRVSEAEIDAARGLMRELNLGPHDIGVAIECFRVGKTAGYDADYGVDRFSDACGPRNDLKRAFIEIQLRAALAGNGISPPARDILARVAERLGLSGLEFAHMEASVRSSSGSGRAEARATRGLADCYTELEVAASATDQEVTKAYRRQMSRHHPDKLVAKGLPESMAQMAKEKTQRIAQAYEIIRTARGMR